MFAQRRRAWRSGGGGGGGGSSTLIIIIIFIFLVCMTFSASVAFAPKIPVPFLREKLLKLRERLPPKILAFLPQDDSDESDPGSTGGSSASDSTSTPQNCVATPNAWGACSATCGGGTQTRGYTITTAESGGGTCPQRSQTDSQPCNTQACPIDCVGEWEDIHGFCARDFGSCGTAAEARFSYDIKTSAADGGAACPHAQDATKTINCDLPACPTVDTTETINGVTYDVKYYDSADGHSAYMYVYTYDLNYPKNTAYWNGQMVAETGDDRYGNADDPTRGSDGHGYIRGDEMKGRYGTRTNYVVKRSQEPIKGGTCELNKTTEYEQSLYGRRDYECAGICGGMQSKSTCESPNDGCDYIVGTDIYSVSARSGTSLASACKWIPDGETQDYTEPKWETKPSGNILSFTLKKLSGDVLETNPGKNPYSYVQSNGVTLELSRSDARLETKDRCIQQCFGNPDCTGVNTNFPSGSEPSNSCTLFSGNVEWGHNGNSLGSAGYKLTR